MKKLLDSDWLRAVLFKCNTVQKKVTPVLILQADKFLKCDWLRPVVFKPNLKYLHVKITPVT